MWDKLLTLSMSMCPHGRNKVTFISDPIDQMLLQANSILQLPQNHNKRGDMYHSVPVPKVDFYLTSLVFISLSKPKLRSLHISLASTFLSNQNHQGDK